MGDPEGAGMKEGGEPGNRSRLSRRPLRTWCHDKEKKRNEVFSFPFQRTKKIKRRVGRPEHS